ncbi:hypothetical protein SGRIM128S_02691 [Streptomyces griseomycini]
MRRLCQLGRRAVEGDDVRVQQVDVRLVIDMLVGAQQRLMIYPQQGFMIEQRVPDDVITAYERLRDAGFTSRLVADTAAQK